MSGIRQYQRRALEALKPEMVHLFKISGKDKCYLNGVRIYLLGISEGIGTCSDLRRVNIAVFGWEKPLPYRFSRNVTRADCEWAALLREPSEQELKEKGFDNESYLLVEGIEISKTESREGYYCMNFIFTGKKKIYANTIC